MLITSHLTRGAWIEIAINSSPLFNFTGRTSHEVRGLKYDDIDDDVICF